MKGKRAATFVMIAIVAVIMITAVLIINQTTIFQEGNPLPVFGGIWRLSVGGEQFAQIRDEPATYIAKTGQHAALFEFIEKTYGVKFKEQMDSRYIFESDDKKVTVTSRRYSRSFQIWEMPEK